jgi:hypothetical protein
MTREQNRERMRKVRAKKRAGNLNYQVKILGVRVRVNLLESVLGHDEARRASN